MKPITPTIKILTIVASAIILLSFFLPWIDTFGQTISAAKIIEQVANSLKYIGEIHNDEQALYILIPVSLLVMPICSFIILIITSSIKTLRPLRFPKILMAIVMTIYLGYMIYGESKNPFSGHGGSVFSLLGAGFYLTFCNVIFLFITIFLKPQPVVLYQPIADLNQQRYCAACGKAYNLATVGQYCENCGTKF